MGRLAGVLMLVVALAAGLAVLWLGDAGDTRVLLQPELPLGSAALDIETTPLDAIATVDAPLIEGRLPTGDSAPDESLAPGPLWPLRVIDEATRAPVAAADVYFFSPRRVAELSLLDDPSSFFELSRFYARNGRHSTTDASGLTEIPRAQGPFWVIAMTPTRFGGATLQPADAIGHGLQLAVQASEFLEVRVLSAADRRPLAGVAVALRDEGLLGYPIGGKSDAEGLARLGPCMARSNSEPARFATVHGVFRHPVETWARAGSAPLAELLVPDADRLLVRVVDAEGKVCLIDCSLELDWPGRRTAQWVRLPIRAGTVAIPRVELGIPLSLRIGMGRPATTTTLQFTMPNSAGAASVDLALDSGLPLVRVQLRRADGQPIGPASWQVELATNFPHKPGSSTERGGSLRGTDVLCFAHCDLQDGPSEARFTLQVHPAVGEPLGGVFHGSLHGGMNDLGIWVCSPATRLCAGRVVDALGHPVAGRQIDVAPMPPGSIVGLLARPAISGDDGQFELLGWGDARDFSVRVTPLLRSVAASLGQTDLTLVVSD